VKEKEDIKPTDKEFCFVIMPFSTDLDDVYVTIKEAIEEEELVCVRADEIPGAGNIVRNIVEKVYNAKIVIADLTGKNANVLYELGLAHTLGNNVIMLAQDIQEDVPFDLNAHRVIQYDLKSFRGATQLKGNIQDAIRLFNEWTMSANNPVQGFLSPGTKPVPFKEYQTVKRKQEDELRNLKDEKVRLQGKYELADAFIKRITGALGEVVNLEEMLKQATVEMDEKGEVTVSVPSSPDDTKTGGRKRLIFRKVSKSEDSQTN